MTYLTGSDHVGLLERLLAPFLDKLRGLFKPFDRVIQLVEKFIHNVTHLREDTENLAAEILAEVNEWKNFRENIAFRTRVINVSKALEQIGQVKDEIVGGWQSVVDLFRTLKGKISSPSGADAAAEAREAVEDIEKSGFSEILAKFPRFAKSFEKALGIVALVAELLEDMVTFVADLKGMVEALRAIRQNVETGESLFLSQKNRRITVTTTGLQKGQSGQKLRLRVGNLHKGA